MDGKSTIATSPAPGVVMLPCTADDFKDFISGLLGKPQTIGRQIDGPFEIDRDGVRDLDALIQQRILSQNDGALMQFTARIIYDDNSSVLLNSLEDFLSYNEVKPLVSTSLVVNWVFLLKFKGSSAPEKQTIDIRFGSMGRFLMSVRAGLIGPEIFPDGLNGISVKIDHTHRSWGADIDALLKGALEKFTEKKSTVRKLLNEYAFYVSTFVFLTFMSLSVWGLVESARRIEGLYQSKLADLGSSPTDSAMLAYISDAISTGAWTRFGLYGAFFVVLSVVASIIFAGMAGSLCERRQPSFVLLTKESIRERDEAKTSLRNNWLKLVGTALLSGFAGALGKYVFLWITNFG